MNFEQFTAMCWGHLECKICNYHKDCKVVGNVTDWGVTSISFEVRYEKLVKFWRKQKLAKLLEK